MLTLLAAQFADPPAEYRPMMFWIWNGAVTRELIDADIADMKEKGCGGFFIHPMGENFRLRDFLEGISPPYLSDGYFELVRHAVQRAEEAGMYAWLYDEGGWPSGTAQGHVVEGHPELRGKVLTVVRGDGSASPPDGTVAALALPEGEAPVVVSAEAPPTSTGGATVLHFVQQAGGFPVDTMDLAAGRRFIEVTHERYRECVGEHFGKTVPGMFTDEPRVGGQVGSGEIPWTPRMLEAFEEDHGFDLRPWLPLLFSPDALGLKPEDRVYYSEGNLMAVRCAFFDTWTRLHREAYWDQLNAWCHENGLLHIGHVGGEDNLPDHIRGGFGEYFRTAGTLDVPGVDTIWRQLWHGQANLHFPLLLASSAAHQKAPQDPDGPWPATGLAATESFGVYGLGLTFHGMKWVTDYQFVRGINVLGPMARSMFTDKGRLYRTMDHMGPGNPLWQHYRPFADYVGRLSVMGRAGERVASIAVYYPIETLWASRPGKTAGSFETICGLLEDQQIQCDVIGGDALLDATVEDEMLVTPGAAYETIIVPAVEVLRGSVVRKLVEFRSQGGRLILLGGPEWVTEGAQAHPTGDAAPALLDGAFEVDLPRTQDSLMAAFGGSPARTHVLLFDGFSGAFRGGPWLDRFAGRRLVPGTALRVPEDNLGPLAHLLGLTTPRVDLSLAEPLDDVRLMTRAMDGATVHLLVNEGDAEVECELAVIAPEPRRLETWDPDTGERATLTYHEEGAEFTTVSVALAPFGSVVLVAVPPGVLDEPDTPELPELTASFTAGPAAPLAPVVGWEIRQGAVVPRSQLPVPVQPAGGLESGRWDQAEGWENFSGTVAYRARFSAPAEWQQRRVALELSEVCHVAEVWVNGEHAGCCLWPPYLLDIAHLVRDGENEVLVQVTNTLANQALRPDVIEEAKLRGWWNAYCDRAEPMMRESLPSGMEPVVRIWLSGDDNPL